MIFNVDRRTPGHEFCFITPIAQLANIFGNPKDILTRYSRLRSYQITAFCIFSAAAPYLYSRIPSIFGAGTSLLRITLGESTDVSVTNTQDLFDTLRLRILSVIQNWHERRPIIIDVIKRFIDFLNDIHLFLFLSYKRYVISSSLSLFIYIYIFEF